MLLLDQRIGSVELHPHLQTPHTTCELEYGDAVILGRVGDRDVTIGVERKVLLDLIKSIESGRLAAHQLPGMGEQYDRSYLIVEGKWGIDRQRHLCRWSGGSPKNRRMEPLRLGSRVYGCRDIHSFLNSVMDIFNVRLITTGGIEHTAAWIDDIHYWYNKPRHSTAEMMVEQPVPLTGRYERPSPIALAVRGFTGIGGRRAIDISHHFDSMIDLCAASVSDIMSVPGIGKTTAEQLYRQLRGEKLS